jgi:hypothetical protein
VYHTRAPTFELVSAKANAKVLFEILKKSRLPSLDHNSVKMSPTASFVAPHIASRHALLSLSLELYLLRFFLQVPLLFTASFHVHTVPRINQFQRKMAPRAGFDAATKCIRNARFARSWTNSQAHIIFWTSFVVVLVLLSISAYSFRISEDYRG